MTWLTWPLANYLRRTILKDKNAHFLNNTLLIKLKKNTEKPIKDKLEKGCNTDIVINWELFALITR